VGGCVGEWVREKRSEEEKKEIGRRRRWIERKDK
jgi:hypothetical protein